MKSYNKNYWLLICLFGFFSLSLFFKWQIFKLNQAEIQWTYLFDCWTNGMTQKREFYSFVNLTEMEEKRSFLLPFLENKFQIGEKFSAVDVFRGEIKSEFVLGCYSQIKNHKIHIQFWFGCITGGTYVIFSKWKLSLGLCPIEEKTKFSTNSQ